MGIQFNSPWMLLLLLVLPFYLYWIARSTLRLKGLRKKAAIALRGTVLLLLVLALAGMQWYTITTKQAVVFVTDRSDSIVDSPEWTDWMKRAVSVKAPDDLAGVLALGLNAAVERRTDERNLEGFQWSSSLNRQFSNLEAGLRTASGLFSDDVAPRIVLLSDGEENVGDVLRQGRLLRDQGIPVDVLQLPSAQGRDVAVEELKVPERLYQGEQYSLEITLQSTEAVQGELRIYEDNQELSVQQVNLERGENRFVLQSLAKEPGFHRYRAEIYVQGDMQTANNTATSFSRVTGPPKVLVVEGQPNTSQNVLSVLDAGLIGYDVVQPEMLSRDLTAYVGYDSILLQNVPATRLSQQQMEMMEQAVRDYGVGMIMFGGEESYGLGGYFQTPVENALPVYMDLRGKREMPSLGLILVIDKSGSMSDGKMELAQEAAVRTVELLRERDTLGVLAFDSSLWWVSEPEPLTDKEQVIREINSIPADGGTDIYPAVQEAYSKLLDVDAQRKHIILLTDGQSATQQSYEALTAQMLENQITLSTVAIGEGADTVLLERLAGLANGRYYFTNDQSTIPAIFSREATMVSRTYIVDQAFVPIYGQGADWSSWMQAGLPSINAYIATTPKEMAEVVLMSPEPDPLLARWQYGSGRTVAWTSDVTGKWSGDWVSWSGYQQALSQIIKWTFPQFDAIPYELATRVEGERTVLEVSSSVSEYQGELTATVTDENLDTHEISLMPTLPGEYVGELPFSNPGVYLTRIDRLEKGEDEEEHISSYTTGFVIPYSAEYRITERGGAARLERLAETTGGRVLTLEQAEEVFAAEVSGKKQFRDLAYPLLLLALLLWLADIAIRRFSLSLHALRAIVASSRPGRSKSERGAEAAESWSRLRQSKERVNQRLVSQKEDPSEQKGRQLVNAQADSAPRQNRMAQAEASASRTGSSALTESRKTNDSPRPIGEDSRPSQANARGGDQEVDPMSRLLEAKKRKKR
ncbi:VWA domain-containing protein [Paenibacillus senegalensis]|uniref:VWA domain-containing protein n=1 Tax=Paenibacillus senegalensis TaxID=1465766 RepID=UPI000289BA6E|nr:VWA domain-containing protein [Paenibacillus senegalensis]